MVSQRVLVMGQGYVGLPVAIRSVEVGFDVTGLDVDVSKIKRLSMGESHVEDVASERLRAALDTGRFRATADIDDVGAFDVAVVCVPTPLKEGLPDLEYIEIAARQVARKLSVGCTVILESTTYPGTTEELVAPILQEVSGLAAGIDFYLGYSPERIDPGNTTWTLENTPKIVSGINEPSLAAVTRFVQRLVDTTVQVRSTRSAELAKVLENTFRHVNIALVNELAMFANDLGIDIWESIDAAATKPFGFMRFTPGPGVGGHCLPVDPNYLSWQVKRSLGTSFRFVELANEVNHHMPDYVVRRIMASLNRVHKPVSGSVILLLGLAYKKNTADARESPSHVIAGQLTALGATVLSTDPHVEDTDIPTDARPVALDSEVLQLVDIAVLLVDHDAFDLQTIGENCRRVLDCRRVVPPAPHVEYL